MNELYLELLHNKVNEIENKVDNLVLVVTKLQSECERLYKQGGSDGEHMAQQAAWKDYATLRDIAEGKGLRPYLK